jgi:hypothetical protein
MGGFGEAPTESRNTTHPLDGYPEIGWRMAMGGIRAKAHVQIRDSSGEREGRVLMMVKRGNFEL